MLSRPISEGSINVPSEPFDRVDFARIMKRIVEDLCFYDKVVCCRSAGCLLPPMRGDAGKPYHFGAGCGGETPKRKLLFAFLVRPDEQYGNRLALLDIYLTCEPEMAQGSFWFTVLFFCYLVVESNNM